MRRHPAIALGWWLLACGANGNAEADSNAEAGTTGTSTTITSSTGGAAATSSSGGSTRTDSLAGTTGAPVPNSVDCLVDGDDKTTLAFVNACATILTFRGSDIADGRLEAGEVECRDIGSAREALSAKRYWGFVGEDPGGEHHTLAEFTFNTDFYDFDWYNISHVDAFNLPMQVVPEKRPDCEALTCATDLLVGCPEVGQYHDSSGQLVACVSPERDNAGSQVALYFESCDDAYAWSGDDQAGDDPSPVRACAGEDFSIVFCPEAV